MENYGSFTCKRGELNIQGKIWGDLSRKAPVYIMCHGFLGNWEMCRHYAERIAEKGYICLAFDFSGGGPHSASDGNSEDMTIFTEIEDLMAVIESVESQPYTQDISLLGCSQGGLIAAMVAKMIPDRIKKMILLYPGFSLADDVKKGRLIFYRFDPENIPDILGTRPMVLGGDFARTMLDIDIYQEITGYDGPVLLLHGVKDKIIDIAYSRKAKPLYQNCEYHEIAGGRHIFRGEAEEEACRLIEDFV